MNKKKYKILTEEYLYFKENAENQLKLNDKIDNIIIWVISFVSLALGIIFNNLDKFHFKVFSIPIYIFAFLSIIFAIFSRMYSYYFGLSFLANINILKRKILRKKRNERNLILNWNVKFHYLS